MSISEVVSRLASFPNYAPDILSSRISLVVEQSDDLPGSTWEAFVEPPSRGVVTLTAQAGEDRMSVCLDPSGAFVEGSASGPWQTVFRRLGGVVKRRRATPVPAPISVRRTIRVEEVIRCEEPPSTDKVYALVSISTGTSVQWATSWGKTTGSAPLGVKVFSSRAAAMEQFNTKRGRYSSFPRGKSLLESRVQMSVERRM